MNLKQKSVAKSKSSLRDGEGRLAFFAISPFYFLYLVFGIFPILYTSYMAFFSWDPLGEKAFIGLANFTNLLQDEILWKALRNTLSIWVLGTVPQLATGSLSSHNPQSKPFEILEFLACSYFDSKCHFGSSYRCNFQLTIRARLWSHQLCTQHLWRRQD